jgi:ATP phosphoribosyltransferase regulatory subunit
VSPKADIRAEAERLRAAFEARGAEVFEADILQHAGTLLDLYGEDIRARAFVTQDPLQGEMMLRPDFTVPLVERHMAAGRKAARYAYAGEVFRRQEDDPDRTPEYMQAGYEILGEIPAEADAEVFATFRELLAPLGLRAATGDIGLLRAAVAGLRTSKVRKAALMRHLWRPVRFKGLLARYAGEPRAVPEAPELPEFGLRSAAEVAERIARLRVDAAEPRLSGEEIALLDALLAVSEKAGEALGHLRALAADMPAIAEAVTALDARLEALAARGVPVEALDFEASYGRTTLEYYDGFVFGFYADARPDLPPVATGGRYDALTRALGGGKGIPAVGGVIRPGLMLELRA